MNNSSLFDHLFLLYILWEERGFWISCGSHPYVSHAGEDINIKPKTSQSCKRVGVYVDTTAGVLSFYSVSDTPTHLYTFLASFKDTLYAAFKVESGSPSVSFCQML